MWSAYARFIVRHSYLFLFMVIIICTALTAVPLLCRKLPSFTDPIVGFETRGTSLAQRFIAWENLIDETRPSKRLAVNPQEIEDQRRMNRTYNNKTRQDRLRSGRRRISKLKGKKKTSFMNSTLPERTLYEPLESTTPNGHVHWGFGKNVSHEDENAAFIKNQTRKQWESLKEMRRTPDKPIHHNYASGTCGPPVIDYAHLVVTSVDNTSLLSFENVQTMCKMQTFLVEVASNEYFRMCQRSPLSEDLCCPIWSLPNYIALISGKSSCESLTREDVDETMVILRKCTGYFHNFSLMASCEYDRCNVPKFCSQHDAVYNLLFYIIDVNAYAPPAYSNTHVKSAAMFLPLARSKTILPFYQILQSSNLSSGNLYIPAMDFGLKNALFDLWIIEDTWLIGLGAIFVFFCVLFYTKSLVLTVLLFTAITYSLGIAYCMYLYAFNLDFFPFMNLLVIVIVVGIGADDAFIYVKIWKMVSKQLIRDNVVSEESTLTDIKNVSSAGETILVQILEETLRHSIVTIFITTLTTAVAFYASCVSYIPAINCFSVFAGTAVLVNFFLMITLLPVSVFIVEVKMCKSMKVLDIFYKGVNNMWEYVRVILNRFIIACVTKLHIVFVIILGAIGIYSIIVVFYIPGLQLPDTRRFQLFQSSHPFEQYDIIYSDMFLFERYGRDLGTGGKMPLRWIWGVQAIDNGNHMDPLSTGKLIFDDEFSISDPKAQEWLLGFCQRLKAQPFYQNTLGPLLPNCFIETFNMYMNRRCIDTLDKINRTPCCESSRFPYPSETFDYCIIKAMESLYQTPRELFMPGVAGPKFLRSSTPPKVAAIVVEFESVVSYSMSYKKIDQFFVHVEHWTKEELKSAPPTMKSGWFLSDLQFYDLQGTLANGTVIALVLSAALGFIVLIPATKSFIVSVCALTAMIFSSTVTIAILVLNGWKLNVLESVAISTSAGLAVDFSLHYALSYTKATGTKLARMKYALTTSSGPTAAAALTTGSAGIFLLRSHLLPYSQIGSFLALIMCVSWVYATFFLCSLLHIFGQKCIKESPAEEHISVSRVSSVCSGVPNLESHELEQLADSNPTHLTSHSPSSASATTVVLHDELDPIPNSNKRDTRQAIIIVSDSD